MGMLAEDLGKGYVLLRGEGREFQLGVLTLDDLADFELWAEHRSERRAEVICDAAGDDMAEDEKARIRQAASDEAGDTVVDALTPRGLKLMQSADGLRFLGWRAARRNEPGLSFRDFRAALGLQHLKAIQDNIFKITGLAAMATSDPTTPATAGQPTGTESSATLPSTIGSSPPKSAA